MIDVDHGGGQLLGLAGIGPCGVVTTHCPQHRLQEGAVHTHQLLTLWIPVGLARTKITLCEYTYLIPVYQLLSGCKLKNYPEKSYAELLYGRAFT